MYIHQSENRRDEPRQRPACNDIRDSDPAVRVKDAAAILRRSGRGFDDSASRHIGTRPEAAPMAQTDAR